MNTKTINKGSNQKKFLSERFTRINRVIEKLETEVEKAVGRFMQRSGRSSKILRQNFEEIFERISSSEFYSMASEKTEEITKELRRVADDIVEKVKKFDLRVANPLMREIRGNIDELLGRLQETEFVEMAKDKAKTTRRQVLHILNIPSRDDVSGLSRKVEALEKKLKTISRKAA